MLDINCDRCGEELHEKGAILFGPPVEKQAKKWHICVECYGDLTERFI